MTLEPPCARPPARNRHLSSRPSADRVRPSFFNNDHETYARRIPED